MLAAPFRGQTVLASATTPTFSPKSRFYVFARIVTTSATQGRFGRVSRALPRQDCSGLAKNGVAPSFAAKTSSVLNPKHCGA